MFHLMILCIVVMNYFPWEQNTSFHSKKIHARVIFSTVKRSVFIKKKIHASMHTQADIGQDVFSYGFGL